MSAKIKTDRSQLGLSPLDEQTAEKRVGIQQITVKGLFGQFDYELTSDNADLSDLFILYGDNGSGKTTLLQLLFHLLSSSRKSGHRTAIKEISFAHFEVRLANHTSILLWRQNSIRGPYFINIHEDGSKPITLSFGTVDKRENQFATVEQEEQFSSFCASLDLTVYFLSADRRIQSDVFRSDHESSDSDQLRLWRNISVSRRVSYRPNDREDNQARGLAQAMQLASTWIRSQVLQATNKGASSSHNIYSDIVKHIVAARARENADPQNKQKLIAALRSLAEKSSGYARFGFVPLLAVDEMVAAISEGNQDTVMTIETVLTPYIQGTNARLQELEKIYTLTKRFIDDLNGFYSFKTIDFDLRRGLSIRLPNGEALNPELLSSGERHLLLLLCHVLISNDQRSIFIIDEPELSLNIKWQRKLIRTLLHVIGTSNVQFILATHAIELLSEHEENVVKLRPTNDPSRGNDVLADESTDNS